jgi:elongation factor 1-beta
MGEVLVTLKVMPESPDVDLQRLKDAIEKLECNGRFNKIEEEPIAFGLVALKPSFVVAESEGTTDELEEAIRNIKGVRDVRVIGATRLL